MENSECSFCKPKKKDWEEEGFYGYRCPACQGSTAFIIRSSHEGALIENEKKIVIKLCEKYYPDLELKWITKNRPNISHWYDFLVPKK